MPRRALRHSLAILLTSTALFGADVAAGAPAPSPHPWAFTSRDTLAARYPSEDGFARVAVEDGSFGAFLRSLPVLSDDTKVVDYRGAPLYYGGRHPNIAGVVDIDVGTRDLQQCADAVIRLHAEWRYGRGERDLAFHASSGQPLAYRRWLAGERMIADGKTATLRAVSAPRKDDHAAFRAWLDEVFAWANTSSLAREGKHVALAEVRPGDFFVLPGSPFGHAVLVLDVARDERGRAALLLGQSYMPAQSFHVLRPSEAGPAWFVVDPGAPAVKTPFWAPFPASSLRRMS